MEILAAFVTCGGTPEVVLLPETLALVAWLETTTRPVVPFPEPAWLTTAVGTEVGFDTPAAEDTTTEIDEATGTTETVLAGEATPLEPASATGQTVVYNAIVEVIT